MHGMSEYAVDMENAVEKVEIKVSYLEAEVAELNEVIIAQQKNYDALAVEVEALKKKVRDLIEEAGDGDRPSRRPPHY